MSPAQRYFERLRAAASGRRTQLCIGLDPDPERIPGGAAGALRHCSEVVRRTSDLACCYKPNSAFWEQYGPDGWRALSELRQQVPTELPVLLDAKRADFPNTMEAYARAAFDALRMDAVTLHAYHGSESLLPFTRRADRGVYLVCRSSNPGATELQHLDAGGRPLFLRVAEVAQRVNQAGNLGLVVGATVPEQVAEVRRAAPELPFLLPGVGAQGGDLEASVRAAWNGDEAGCLVASSRSVLYAQRPEVAAAELRDSINQVLVAVR